MGEPVQQGAGEPLGAEDLGPLVEGKVAGDERRGTFVPLAEGLEEQLGSGLRQRHIAQLVNDQQLIGGQLLLEPEQSLFVAGLDQFADQRGGGDEADAMTALTGGQAQRQSDVRLAGPARSHNIMPIVRRKSRFTTSGIRCVGIMYESEDVRSCRLGNTSLESFPMEPLAVFQHG